MTQVTPFPLVEVSGPPKRRGQIHGEAARERVRLSVALYTEELAGIGFRQEDIARLVAGFMPMLDRWAPDLVEEMAGIAAGAGIRPEEVALVNMRSEVLQLAQREKGAASSVPDGCTGAVILPEATRDGSLIHGQNWDWKAECADTAIVLRVLRDDGPDFLTFTEAGGLARSGMNSAGVTITANYLESDRDYCSTGIPLPFIRRRVLEAQHFAEALRVVAATPKSCSNNMMVSTAEGYAIDLECAPDEAFAIYPQSGMIVHANHWQSPVALVKLREAGLSKAADSLYRDRRVQDHLSSVPGGLTVADLKDALFDSFGSPYSVCRPWVPDGGNLTATVAMIICEPARGRMEIAALPAINRSFARYELQMDAQLRMPRNPTDLRTAI